MQLSVLCQRFIVLLFFTAINCKVFAQNESKYAGIEVGSKGVKICVLDNDLKLKNLSQKIIYDTTINTDFIKFTGASHDATLAAVLSLFKIANQNYAIHSRNIFLAISSGVKQTADREKKVDYINQLVESIKSLIGDSNREVEVVSVYQESIFTHKSIIAEEDNMTSIIIDIGSGNTKGGYFITSNVFNVFNIPWGTKSITSIVEKVCDSACSNADFAKLLNKSLSTIRDKDIPEAIDKCGITNYDFKIFFSGGIAWATATLAKPQLINEKSIDLSYSDAEELHYQLTNNYSTLTGEDDGKKYLEEKNRIQKVFNQKSLIGGSGLLLSVMKKFERVNGTKSYGFIKNNKAGWLPGYIVNKIEARSGAKGIAYPK